MPIVEMADRIGKSCAEGRQLSSSRDLTARPAILADQYRSTEHHRVE